MNVSKKLYSVVGTLALVGLVMAGSGIWYVRQLGDDLKTATTKTAIKLELVNATRATTWEMVASLRGAYLFSSLKMQDELEASEKRWHKAFKETNDHIAGMRPLLVSEEGKKELKK